MDDAVVINANLENASLNITSALNNETPTISANLQNKEIPVVTNLENEPLRGYSAYEIAVQNGFVGTVSEWLGSLHGVKVLFKSENNWIQYKYENEEEWNNLINLSLVYDYSRFSNKPIINGVELSGEIDLATLGIQPSGDYLKIDEVDKYTMKKHEYDSSQEFPSIPSDDNVDDLFVDKSTNIIYRWDNDDLKYYAISSDYNTIQIIFGGSAT